MCGCCPTNQSRNGCYSFDHQLFHFLPRINSDFPFLLLKVRNNDFKKKYLNSKQITVFNFRVLFCKAIIIGNCVNDTCINLLEKITVKNIELFLSCFQRTYVVNSNGIITRQCEQSGPFINYMKTTVTVCHTVYQKDQLWFQIWCISGLVKIQFFFVSLYRHQN